MTNSIFTGYFGSTLYGLTTPNSDVDIKAIYAPSDLQLATADYKDSIETKVSDDDHSVYSIQKFLKMLNKSDTVSIDMLHTPRHMTLNRSPLWKAIRRCRGDIYSKQATGMLGYIKTQASKYGHKVRRLEEMQDLLAFSQAHSSHIEVYNTTISQYVASQEYKFISVNPRKGDVLENIDICGSRIQTNTSVEHFCSLLSQKVEQYGKRAKRGSIEGGDWKALSHAYRVLLQMEEIIDTRDLIFPLVKAPEIMEVKLGQIAENDVIAMIDAKYDELMEKLESSDLPDNPNTGNIQAHIMNYYFGG